MKVPGPGTLWKLARPLWFGEIMVPSGFISDGNSIPVKSPASEAAGWLHDFLYRKGAGWSPLGSARWHCPTRAEADRIFYEALLEEGVPKALALTQYGVVRLLGWRYWRRLPVEVAKEDS